MFGTIPLVLVMIYTDSLMMAFAMNLAHHLFSAAWPGIPPSTAADLVMPRMRAVAGAYYILVNTFIGLALGPYFMGQLSDGFRAGEVEQAADSHRLGHKHLRIDPHIPDPGLALPAEGRGQPT